MGMDGNTIDLLSRLLSSLGFPVFVAVWLMVRTDTILRELRDAIRELKSSLERRN